MTATRDVGTPLGRGEVVLDVRDLRVVFDTRRGRARAVDGVTLTLRAGETLGLVGESGCGKTVTALSLMRSVPSPGIIDGGSVSFEGRDLLAMPEAQVAKLRGRRIALIPQDPLTALNPVMTVGEHITEVLDDGRVIFHQCQRRRFIIRIGRALHPHMNEVVAGMRRRFLALPRDDVERGQILVVVVLAL